MLGQAGDHACPFGVPVQGEMDKYALGIRGYDVRPNRVQCAHAFRHYLPFLTMSSDFAGCLRSLDNAARGANRVDQSPDIVFLRFSALQIIEESKQLVSWLIIVRASRSLAVLSQGPVPSCGCRHAVLGQQVLHAVDAETVGPGIREEHVALTSLRFSKPVFQPGKR